MAENNQQETDFNALYAEAGDLDDGESYRDDPVAAEGADPVEEDEEPAVPVEDGMGDDDFYDTDAPLDSPDVEAQPAAEPEATPEELKASKRQDLLNRQRAIEREAQQFQAEFGEPVVPKEVQERIAKGEAALESVKQDLPEVLEAVELLVEQRIGGAMEQTHESISSATREQQIDTHENAILAVHPEYAELREDPAPVLAWIDELPAKYAGFYQQVMEKGSADEIIGLLNDFKDYPDPAEAALALDAAVAGTKQPVPAQQAQPGTPSQGGRPNAPASKPRQSNLPEAALAVRGRGTGRIPQASGQPATDDFDAAYREFAAIEAQEARSA